jgi:hypothetical protein
MTNFGAIADNSAMNCGRIVVMTTLPLIGGALLVRKQAHMLSRKVSSMHPPKYRRFCAGNPWTFAAARFFCFHLSLHTQNFGGESKSSAESEKI